jgi:hypothetical protein
MPINESICLERSLPVTIRTDFVFEMFFKQLELGLIAGSASAYVVVSFVRGSKAQHIFL